MLIIALHLFSYRERAPAGSLLARLLPPFTLIALMCARAHDRCLPATIVGFNVFLISHEVTEVLSDRHSIIGCLCEHQST